MKYFRWLILYLLIATPVYGGTLWINGLETTNGTNIVNPIITGATITESTGRFGDDSNYLDIDGGGVVSMVGTAKRSLMLRPSIDVITQIFHAKPTQYTRGAHKGFSMPIWDSGGNADEQLFLYSIVPQRWDGVSDLKVCAATILMGAEDVGDKFKFRLLWDCVNCEEVMGDTMVDVDAEITVLTGRSAAYNVYRLEFTIDHDTIGHVITPGCLLSWVLRRVGASASEVTNEIGLFVSSDSYGVNKMFGE